MDVSIIAALSSFIVSERVIKAKATVLIILLGVVAYDLSLIHLPNNNAKDTNHDPSSLRVYRGPALIAIVIISVAFSLRTWRRNGVACDELLFLPGTVYAEKHGIMSPEDMTTSTVDDADAAAGKAILGNNGFIVHLDKDNLHLPESSCSEEDRIDEEESVPMLRLNNNDIEDKTTTTTSCDSNNSTNSSRFWCMSINQLRRRRSNHCNSPSNLNSQNFNHSRPRRQSLTRYFASTNDDNNFAYAPSGPSVASAALDLFLPVLFNFHLFMMATKSTSDNVDVPPQILPMIFLSILIIRCLFPFNARHRFWKTLRYTILAPYYTVTFRDDLIGDLLTSMVRPLQDVSFAIFYYFNCWWAIFHPSKGDLKGIGNQLQQNRFLNNVIFPICVIIPLSCKFIQTLRQAYCTQRRWPHLGNAFKYLTASVVVYYAMVNPEGTRSYLWLFAFILAMLYQIWWDIFIDWELLIVIPPNKTSTNSASPNDASLDIKSLPNGDKLSPLSNHTDNSLEAHKNLNEEDDADSDQSSFIWKLMEHIPTEFKLRPNRLFKSDTYYWKLLWINVFLRFAWMVAFIPTHRLDEVGQINYTFSSDVKAVGGFIIALAEIVRRCCWGILKVELETIKMTTTTNTEELSTLDLSLTGLHNCFLKVTKSTNQQLPSGIDAPNQYVFLVELGIWIAADIAITYYFFFS